MDIRCLPEVHRGRLLRERWPRPMHASLGWTPEEGSAVTCVIIVLKMIISYTDKSPRNGGYKLKSVQAQGEAEKRNVLLRYAWHDTSDGVDGAAVLRLQKEVYDELMAPESQWADALSGGVTFERLMESMPMWRDFWSRPQVLFHVGLEVEMKEGRAPLSHILRTDGTRKSTVDLARDSLIEWCPDGKPVENVLNRRVMRGPSFQKILGWSYRPQECIRLRYDPSEGKHRPGFKDLMTIYPRPESLHINRNGAKWGSRRELEYSLVAVVRLGFPAYIRTYDKAGQYSIPNAAHAQSPGWLNNEWKLGQDDAQYMLYYVSRCWTDPEPESGNERPSMMSGGDILGGVALQQQSFSWSKVRSTPPSTALTEPIAGRVSFRPGLQPTNPGGIRASLGRGLGFGGEAMAAQAGQNAAFAPGHLARVTPEMTHGAPAVLGSDLQWRPKELFLPPRFSVGPQTNILSWRKRPYSPEEATTTPKAQAFTQPQNTPDQPGTSTVHGQHREREGTAQRTSGDTGRHFNPRENIQLGKRRRYLD